MKANSGTVLILDNYDSFVYNLARYVNELGGTTIVRRNDAITLAEIENLHPDAIIISPGPCTPTEAGISNTVIAHFGVHTPILGVCLGHQCIGEVFGGRVVRSRKPMHGKACPIQHTGKGLFAGLPNPLRAGRYHSLIVDLESLPSELIVTACSNEGEIMGLQHTNYPIYGLQFHPESVLTEHGHTLLQNFLALT